MGINCEPWGAEFEIDGFWRLSSNWDLVAEDELVFLNLSLMRRLEGERGAAGRRFLDSVIGEARLDWTARAGSGSHAGSGSAVTSQPARPQGRGWMWTAALHGGGVLRSLLPQASRLRESGSQAALLARLGVAVLDRAMPVQARSGKAPAQEPWIASFGALLSFHSGVNAGYLMPDYAYHADLYAACAWLGVLARGRPARAPTAIFDFIRWSESSVLGGLGEQAADDPHHVLRLALDAAGLSSSLRRDAGPLPALVWPSRPVQLSAAAEATARRFAALLAPEAGEVLNSRVKAAAAAG